MYYTNQHIRDQTKCCSVSYTYVVYMHLHFFWNNIYHVLYNNKSNDFNNCISIMADKFSLDICHDSRGDHVVHRLSSHPHPVLWYSVKIWFSCCWEGHTKILIWELFAEWWLLTCAFECVMAFWQLFILFLTGYTIALYSRLLESCRSSSTLLLCKKHQYLLVKLHLGMNHRNLNFLIHCV